MLTFLSINLVKLRDSGLSTNSEFLVLLDGGSRNVEGLIS